MSTGWSRKTGLVAIEPNANIVFSIQNISREIGFFHLMTLKSNTEPWKDGKARFRLAVINSGDNKQQQQAQETSFDISATHYYTPIDKNNKDVPVTYHFTVDFEKHKAPIGSNVMLSVEVVEGTSFKILGLMLCSS